MRGGRLWCFSEFAVLLFMVRLIRLAFDLSKGGVTSVRVPNDTTGGVPGYLELDLLDFAY